MDEIKLFEGLQPPPPPEAARMREAARERLTAAASAPQAHPGMRRSTVVTVAAAAALVAAGTGYGIAATQGGSGHLSGGARHPASTAAGHATAAGLTAVHGCPGEYITAGTLKRVSGTQLVIQPADAHERGYPVRRARPVTVTTTASTAITRPARGTLSDVTDGSHVDVQGTWSGGKLAATEIGIEARLPAPGTFGPRLPAHTHVRTLKPPNGLGLPFASGKVVDAHSGGFTVVQDNPALGIQRIKVITSDSTKVLNKVGVSLGRLSIGSNVVAVGRIGSGGVMAASTVAEQAGMKTLLAGGPVRIRPSGCSAAAITTAVVLAGG